MRILFCFTLSSLFHISFFAQIVDSEKAVEKMEIIVKDNIENAIKYGDSILKFPQTNKGLIYLKIGMCYVQARQYYKAIPYLDKSETYFIKQEKTEELIYTYISLGKAKASIDKNGEALQHLFKAKELSIKTKDKDAEFYSLTILSHLYYGLDDYKKAIEINKEASIILEKTKDTSAISFNLIDLGVFYEQAGEIDSALYYSEKALGINKLLQNKYRTGVSYNNIAKIYKIKKDYKKAIDYYKKAIALKKQMQISNLNPTKNLASLYLEINDLNQANNYYLKALEETKKNKNFGEELEVYEELLKISIKQKKFNKAQEYLKLKDSLNTYTVNIKNEEKVKLIDDKYKSIIKEENLKKELEINKKNKIIFASLVGVLLLLGLFFLQKNRNKQLELNQEKLVLEQRVLRSQMNPHFIFNALTSIQKNLLDEDLLKSSTSLARFAKLIRQNFEFTNKKLINLDEDLNALKNYIETQQLRFEDKFDYQINVQKGLDISFIKIPPMLLQPFVENAIEHGLKSNKQKGSLIINIFDDGDLIHFEVIDDGVGFKQKKKVNDREHANEIFFKRLKLRNLNEEKSFVMQSYLDNGKGTKISFALQL